MYLWVHLGRSLRARSPSASASAVSLGNIVLANLLALSALLLSGCSTPLTIGGDGGDPGETVDSGSAAEVRPEPELVPVEDGGPDWLWDWWGEEQWGEGGGGGCQPGDGCFLDPCSENSQCLSGWCADHLGAGVCTEPCTEECQPGWSCRPVGTGPDLTYICISNYANLCKPCTTSEGCKAIGGAEDICLDYGSEGSFCGGACKSPGDCPWGFLCTDAVSVEGVTTKQCLAESGVCPCTAKSVALALTTPCVRNNEFGTCQGKRVCQEGGLSACDAPDPQAESCNGLDDDCDGQVDEANDRGGESLPLCSDGNSCTKDFCNGADGCSHQPLDGGECLDGNPCTIADHCEQGLCVGLAVNCDDGNPCTDDFCDNKGGCYFEFNQDPCDDSDPCTVADQCSLGICVGVAIPCDCQGDKDCAILEDGNLCNGKLRCNLETWPFKCQVDPATVVICPAPPAGPDAPCLAPLCAPSTGSCSLAPANDGFLCDDGSQCTAPDLCQQGKCIVGKPLNCNDGDQCTTDSCDAAFGCLHKLHTGPCDDGDGCTVGDACSNGSCVGGGPLACDDGNPCTKDSCNPAAGCQHLPVEGPCDDGNGCTLGDKCVAGQCGYSSLLSCNDKNVCTNDSCDPKSGCIFLMNNAPCDDGNLCTTGDFCNLGQCTAAGMLTCIDGNPCTKDSCAPSAGCQFTPFPGVCDDGNACTTGDLCANGKCSATGSLDCDDGSPCTKDSCLPLTGCLYTLLSGPCEDGSACTVGDKCDNLGMCISGQSISCDDGNVCTHDYCDNLLGCVHEPKPGACNDGNPCTIDDQCLNGQCQPGAELVCDDDNPCTADSCDPAAVCIHLPLEILCDDKNACTVGDFCSKGSCKSGPALNCNDNNHCTLDLCQPESGCDNQPIVPCCGNGALEAGEDCDDGNLIDGDGCEADCKEFHPVNVTFTTCGASGPNGPSQGQCDNAYAGQAGLAGKVTLVSGIQRWTVPYNGTYRIEAYGARGGSSGGNGARMIGDFLLTGGTELKIIVGQPGLAAPAQVGNGGGGGSFVARTDNTPLIVAGGGGGTGHNSSYPSHSLSQGQTGTSGNPGLLEKAGEGGSNGQGGKESYTTGNGTPNGGGGGGFYGDGGSSGAARGGKAFVNGGVGGDSTGGFGGGGGSNHFVYGCGSSPHGGSGGGGYSGGGAGGDNCNGPGGGGGSYNGGENQSNSVGANGGDGQVKIQRL